MLELNPKDAGALEDFVERVRRALGGGLVALKLFGSKASGQASAESDIDVLVEVEDATLAIEDEVLRIAFDVNLKHGVYVSPRVIARATMEDPVWAMTPFLRALAKEGIPL